MVTFREPIVVSFVTKMDQVSVYLYESIHRYYIKLLKKTLIN